MTLLSLLLLYLVFRLKQLMCDFILQNSWMALRKGDSSTEGWRALFSHTVIHACGTLIVTLLFAPSLFWLAGVDFIIHSVIDRVKGYLTLRYHWTYSDRNYWWAFGIDQEAHNITHLVYIILILMARGGLASV